MAEPPACSTISSRESPCQCAPTLQPCTQLIRQLRLVNGSWLEIVQGQRLRPGTRHLQTNSPCQRAALTWACSAVRLTRHPLRTFAPPAWGEQADWGEWGHRLANGGQHHQPDPRARGGEQAASGNAGSRCGRAKFPGIAVRLRILAPGHLGEDIGLRYSGAQAVHDVRKLDADMQQHRTDHDVAQETMDRRKRPPESVPVQDIQEPVATCTRAEETKIAILIRSRACRIDRIGGNRNRLG